MNQVRRLIAAVRDSEDLDRDSLVMDGVHCEIHP